jgi:hypothetical protein
MKILPVDSRISGYAARSDVNKATEEIPHVKSAIDCYHNSFRIYSSSLT